ncbi:MAG TPA: cyanophycinase, partial [Pilimelia sp.]|nr:cyanophycinase [Pilimelia sp.]
AGGTGAHVAVVAAASTDPVSVSAEYVTAFRGLGAAHVEALRVQCRADGANDTITRILAGATGVYFTGGDQDRLVDLLCDTPAAALLHTRLSAGLVLAGTSAGAAAMSDPMLTGGRDTGVRTSSVRLHRGLGFLPGLLVDMHFHARGRADRLLSGTAMVPDSVGMGVDEDTAAVVRDDQVEVVGSGAVTVVDVGAAGDVHVPAEGDGPIALGDAHLYVVPAGWAFDLSARRLRRAAAGALSSR